MQQAVVWRAVASSPRARRRRLPAFGILWDEQVDLDIARSYVHEPAGWVSDPGEDAINLRLPMYTRAVAFALLDRDVVVGRAVSCGVTLLTLAAVFVYARRFGRPQAFLAAALVATSPFVLAFSRVAFTEGDAFVTAGLAWSLVLVAAAIERPSLGRATLAGVVYGLAIASKFVAGRPRPLWTRWTTSSPRSTARSDARAGTACGATAPSSSTPTTATPSRATSSRCSGSSAPSAWSSRRCGGGRVPLHPRLRRAECRGGDPPLGLRYASRSFRTGTFCPRSEAFRIAVTI
jgi:hypothetical protein